ncbi:unnamed protein product [Polarella glacialis]|uniref:Calcineurin-like phosphoesterase domain-containing protein n=1 Tax=Polarella glacialis TaxID=89957 RepID=A0A813HAE7_POLGL|nr:unnamed protein product [Polarella glacialis]
MQLALSAFGGSWETLILLVSALPALRFQQLSKHSFLFSFKVFMVLQALSVTCTKAAASPCLQNITPPESPPESGTSYNGIALPDVCLKGPEKYFHFFVISDWGGISDGGGQPVPAVASRRPFVKGVDDKAQQLVAAQMSHRSKVSRPRFVLNAGDMFYWGGIEAHCGLSTLKVTDPKEQFTKVFEQVYTGEGLAGVPWLGTLGNHDFGERSYTNGWDQIIAYTWGPGGRWVTPALYWRQRIHHADFVADFFFVDTNFNDVNKLCSSARLQTNGHVHSYKAANIQDANCGVAGPTSLSECVSWFHDLWSAQLAWLEDELYASTAKANWQVVVTHYPPEQGWQLATWRRLSAMYGIDLFVTGHRHQQEVHPAGTGPLGDTAHVVSGGGGGITSEKVPSVSGHDDQYGFMDISLSRQQLKIKAISHGGVIRSVTMVKPRKGTHGPNGITSTRTPASTTKTSSTTSVISTSTSTTSFTSTSKTSSTTTSITITSITTTTTSISDAFAMRGAASALGLPASALVIELEALRDYSELQKAGWSPAAHHWATSNKRGIITRPISDAFAKRGMDLAVSTVFAFAIWST